MEGLKACRDGDAAVVGGVGNISRGLLDKVGAEGGVEDGLENTKNAEVKGLGGLGGVGGEEVNKDEMKTKYQGGKGHIERCPSRKSRAGASAERPSFLRWLQPQGQRCQIPIVRDSTV